MNPRMARLARCGLLAFVLLPPGRAEATSLVSNREPCPVCGEQSDVLGVASYGGYIFRWPSRTEYVFWPDTDPEWLFTCRRCHLSVLTDDLAGIPQDRIGAIRSALEGTQAIGPLEDQKAPIPARLPIAERVYEAWNPGDREMSRFYRVAGFHYAAAGATAQAERSRRRALDRAARLLQAPTLTGTDRREMHVISGAMHQLLGEDLSALEHFGLGLLAWSDGEKETGRSLYLLELSALLVSRNAGARWLGGGAIVAMLLSALWWVRRRRRGAA